MALEATKLRAQILSAKLAATIGAVDDPLATVYNALGLPVRPGMVVQDQVTGEIMEVQYAGIEQIDADTGG